MDKRPTLDLIARGDAQHDVSVVHASTVSPSDARHEAPANRLATEKSCATAARILEDLFRPREVQLSFLLWLASRSGPRMRNVEPGA
jgi:hypothetical protein